MAPLVKEKMARKPNLKSDGIKEVTPATPSKPKVGATLRNSKVVATPRSTVTATPRSKVAATPRSTVTATPRSKVAATPRSRVAATPRSKVTATSRSKTAATPDIKVVAPSTIKKSRKHRPQPAHSGVPVPEKLKKLLEKRLREPDDSL